MSGGGKITVLVMVVAGLVIAIGTVWLQHLLSQPVLEFWGPAAARLISAAPEAEIALPAAGDSSPKTSDIRTAKGIQNIRHALIQGETFLWDTRTETPLTEWDYALRFSEGSQQAVVLYSVSGERVGLEGKGTSVRLHPVAAKEFKLFCDEQFAKQP